MPDKNNYSKNWVKETHLVGKEVKLIPLHASHKNELLKAAQDGELWKLWFTTVPSAKTIDDYLDSALKDQQAGKCIPFSVVDPKSDCIIGSTRFLNLDIANKRLEIGNTWYAQSYQRTIINTACKYLLLNHAFEELGCIAVEFRTHSFNHASRNAILRLGAHQDGILRNHRVINGLKRDTVVFSILDSEWPVVKQHLEFKMGPY